MAVIQHDEALEETGADLDGDALSEIHARALKRFSDSVVPQQLIRLEALTARRFISIPGAQWEGEWGEQFENAPRVEIDKLARGVEKIVNDYRQNRIVPDFRPAGGESNQQTADTLDGVYRADAYHFKAQQALDNAFEEAAAGGFGAWRLINEWADPYDKESDAQRINPGILIADADQRVFFDGNSKLYDKSDARFAFVVTAMTRDAFEEEYPGKEVSWTEDILRIHYDFFTPDVIRICEYYEVEDRDEKLLVFTHGLSGEEQRFWSSDIESKEVTRLRAEGYRSESQSRKRRRVHKYLMSGAEILKDQGFIAGSNIPVVPVYGKRWFVDNQERIRGHVSKRMDAQRLYNSKVSKLAEIDALAPREIPIFAPEQMTGNIPTQWAEANMKRLPYLLANPLIDPVSGAFASLGPIGKVEPPQVPPVTAGLLQIAGNDLTEDDEDQSEQVKANTSVDAMDLAAARVDAKSGIYLDNMRQSVQRAAEIYLDMAKEVYSEPGRVVETMSEEGDDGQATLGQSYTDDQGNNTVINDFAQGKYKVIADVTEATTTRRDKTVRMCLNLASVAVQAQALDVAKVALLTAVMNQDGEGMADVQTWSRKQLVSGGIVPPTDDEKKQMAAAQQEAAQQPPDTQTMLAHAKTADLMAAAGLKQAKGQEAQAKTGELVAATHLKTAQANAIGGPDEAPAAPDGLEQARTAADIGKTAAETEQIRAATAHMPAKLAIEAHNAETDRMKIRRGSETVQ